MCSFLICLPGYLLWVGADVLAEVTFAKVPLTTTPSVIWKVVAVVVAIALAAGMVERILAS